MSKISNWSQFKSSNPILENSSDISSRAFKKMQFCRMQVVKNQPFFGHLAMKLVFQERLDLPYKTMATDGNNLYYDPNFVLERTGPEIEWVIIHEVMHCILVHFTRKMPDPRVWNAACDYALNALIDPDNPANEKDRSKLGKMVEGALRDTKFDGMRAEDIYQFLIENNVQLPPEEGWNYGGVLPPVPGNKKSAGGGGGGKGAKLVKVGDFVATNAGQYGKVLSIDGETGEVEMQPMTKAELTANVESTSGQKVKTIY
jgi:hypothetical protein